MFLSRIRLRPEAPQSEAFWEWLGNAYEVHRLVWSWFADHPDRQRDFLFRVEGAGVGACIYTLSTRRPTEREDLWKMESKEFSPRLNCGDRLAFLLRANPVRRRAQGLGKGKRHDVIMDAKMRARDTGGGQGSEAEWVQSESVAWLLARAERAGFRLDPAEVRADGYNQLRLTKGRGAGEIRISTVDLRGQLTVVDAQLFTNMLCRGLGPAKSFGCGLMLVRRV